MKQKVSLKDQYFMVSNQNENHERFQIFLLKSIKHWTSKFIKYSYEPYDLMHSSPHILQGCTLPSSLNYFMKILPCGHSHAGSNSNCVRFACFRLLLVGRTMIKIKGKRWQGRLWFHNFLATNFMFYLHIEKWNSNLNTFCSKEINEKHKDMKLQLKEITLHCSLDQPKAEIYPKRKFFTEKETFY